MLKLSQKSSKVSKNLIKISFLSLTALISLSASAQAQSLNDDLAPKTKTEQKSKSAKASKKVVRKTLRRTPVAVTPATPVAAVSAETPAQIFERFMNFQQTGSVTYKDWENVIRQTQANPNDANAKAQNLMAQGELAFNRNDYSNALVQFNAAAQVLPNSALPPYGIGRVYLMTKQPLEAENSFERAIKLNKNFALAYKGMGDALTAQGKAKKAKEYYEEAAKIGLASGNMMVKTSSTQPVQNNTRRN